MPKASNQRLGRGLGALIPNVDNSDDDKRILEIDPKLIKTNPYQPRLEFDVQALEELKASIKEKGLIQPIAVRKVDNYYELIAGERRLRSVIDLGFKKVPAYILDIETKEDMLEIALIENVQREKLNVIELAISYKRLVDECGLTIEQVGKTIGKDRSTINNVLRLLKLPQTVQTSLKENKISMGHARAILGAPSIDEQINVLDKVLKNDLSVRKTEEIVKSVAQIASAKKEKRKSSIKKTYHTKMESMLRDLLGTQVKLSPKSKGGSIDIEYYSDEDLHRLYEIFERMSEV